MTTLLAIAGLWGLVALVAALWLGAAMRHAEQAEQRRLERERATVGEHPGEDDRRTA